MSESASYVFGIDLGTTYSCISYLKDGHPVVCQSLEGDYTTPSVVRIMPEEDFPVVGRTAKDMAVIYPEYTIQFERSMLGHVDTIEYGTEYDKHTTTPVAVMAAILKKLATDASVYTNTTVKDVVISVPAYYGNNEKYATREAGIKAGLNVIDIIEAPIAVAYYYGWEIFPELEVTSSQPKSKRQNNLYKEIQLVYGPPSFFHEDDEKIENYDQVAQESESKGESILDRFKNEVICIFDLGGGTFDVTAMKMENGKMTVLTTDGNHDLGGRNWDAELIEMVKEKFKEATGYDEEFDSEILQDFQLKCETAKRQLTNVSQTNIPITIDRKNKANITITREEFDSRTSYLLAAAIDITHHVFDRIVERGETITKILLVGGSTIMPQIHEGLVAEFNLPVELLEPFFAVAKGASIYAGYI